MAYRKNEKPRTWFRSERVFCSDGLWYFHTREGIDVGPYKGKFEAEVDAEMLKSLIVGVEGEQAKSIIREFMLDDRTTLGGRNLSDSAFTDYLLQDSATAV